MNEYNWTAKTCQHLLWARCWIKRETTSPWSACARERDKSSESWKQSQNTGGKGTWGQISRRTKGTCREGDGSPLQCSCLESPMDGGAWWAAVHGVAKSRTRLSDCTFIFHFHALEKEMAPHSSTLAWKIPWMEEPGRLQSMGSLRVGHNWATALLFFTFMHWRRKWQPTPVFLPGESQGQGSLAGCRLWGRTESDTTEVT